VVLVVLVGWWCWGGGCRVGTPGEEAPTRQVPLVQFNRKG
jgi:hypothetical protein